MLEKVFKLIIIYHLEFLLFYFILRYRTVMPTKEIENELLFILKNFANMIIHKAKVDFIILISNY